MALKKRKAFFPAFLSDSNCHLLKEQCCAVFLQLRCDKGETLESLPLSSENSQARVRETEELSDWWRGGWDTDLVVCASSPEENQTNKCPSVYQMQRGIFSPQQEVFRSCFEWILHSETEEGGLQKRDCSIKLQLSTFRWQQSWTNHLNLTTHLSSDIKHNLRPASLMHMLFLTKCF